MVHIRICSKLVEVCFGVVKVTMAPIRQYSHVFQDPPIDDAPAERLAALRLVLRRSDEVDKSKPDDTMSQSKLEKDPQDIDPTKQDVSSFGRRSGPDEASQEHRRRRQRKARHRVGRRNGPGDARQIDEDSQMRSDGKWQCQSTPVMSPSSPEATNAAL